MAGDRSDFLSASMRGLPPKAALTFLLSSRAMPLVTSRRLRSLTRNDRVLAICAGATPWPSAASATVAVLPSNSTMVMSGARVARKARTDSRLILTNLQAKDGTNYHGQRDQGIAAFGL
jgi:hypothetical protein